MRELIAIIAIIGLATGLFFSEEKNKSYVETINTLSLELQDKGKQIRTLEQERNSFSRALENAEKKLQQNIQKPEPKVVQKEETPIQPQETQEQKTEQPKDTFLEDYYANQERRQSLINQIKELERQISSTQMKLHDKEREWAIEDSKRGIRTSQHERNELRTSVRNYLSQLEAQKRELEIQIR